MPTSTPADYVKLHLVILLWGFTGILGDLIQLSAPVLTFYRVSIAAALLLALIKWRRIPGAAPDTTALPLLANGLLLGLHWILFFLAIHIANVSVAMLGLATTALWTVIIEPMLVKGRRRSRFEFFLGAVMIAAILLIAGGDFQYRLGLAVAVACALVGTTFSILNSGFTQRHHHHVIALYQMLGATMLSAVAIAVLPLFAKDKPALIPTTADLGWLLLLASFCTVYAYSQYVELLKRLRVFTVHLAYNLEPVYGILLAALIFKEHQQLSPNFYLGAALILAAVIAHPFAERSIARQRS